jgi:hypothetical protein
MVAGVQWQGFAWNPNASPNGGAMLAIWSAQGSSFTGGFSYLGHGHVMNGRVSMADGSVTLIDALNSPPLTLSGRISPTPAGGYMATLAVSQATRGLGTVKMLWLRNKFTPDGLFPPGPCFSLTVGYSGRFASGAGDTHGLIGLLFDPERKAGDSANPPSIETGVVAMQDLHFNFVATIDPERKAGGYDFDLLGQASDSLLLPAVYLGGSYMTDAMTGRQLGFQGGFQLFDARFSPTIGGSFSAFAP